MYKGRCINFELWFVNEEHQDLDQVYATLESLIKQDIDSAVNDGCNAVIGLLLFEGFLYKNHDAYYDLLGSVYRYGSSKGIIKWELVCGIVWDYQAELDKRNLKYDIVEFDYSANAMWQSYKNRNTPEWNSEANGFLFLGGVPSRENRITLLSKFYDKGMLDDAATWSFFLPSTPSEEIECRNLLNHYTDQQYQEFLDYAERRVDNCYYDVKDYSKLTGKEWKTTDYLSSDFITDPNYISPDIFTNTSVSVIAEGHVYPPAWDARFLTEKTWRAIINRHPFILADSVLRREFAKSKGINIFDEFFPEEYDDIEYLDGVVENVSYFLKVKDSMKARLKEITDNNFLALVKVIAENEEKITRLKEKFALSEQEINDWFMQKSFDHLFRTPDPIKEH